MIIQMFICMDALKHASSIFLMEDERIPIYLQPQFEKGIRRN